MRLLAGVGCCSSAAPNAHHDLQPGGLADLTLAESGRQNISRDAVDRNLRFPDALRVRCSDEHRIDDGPVGAGHGGDLLFRRLPLHETTEGGVKLLELGIGQGLSAPPAAKNREKKKEHARSESSNHRRKRAQTQRSTTAGILHTFLNFADQVENITTKRLF